MVQKSDRPTVVHCKQDSYDMYIGRGDGGDLDFLSYLHGEIDAGERGWLGNPFKKDEYGRETCIEMFRYVLEKALAEHPRRAELRRELRELKGARLGCFCAPKACHGDVLAATFEKL